MTSRERAATPSADEALADFMNRWAEAIVSNNVDRMDRYVTEDWVLIDKPGIITRESFHRVVAAGQLSHTRMTHEVLFVRHVGPDAVVIGTRGRNAAVFQGEDIVADEWTTNILVRHEDGWRCSLTQLTPTA